MDHIWVWGKVTPGWYMASWIFDPDFMVRCIINGYIAVVSEHQPE